MLLSLLVYGCATRVFGSGELERAAYDFIAFRFIAANDHREHDTIATFRGRFLKEIEALFVKVLLLAREMGVLEMGTVALDGTKVHADASRRSAFSYEHAGKIEARLRAEVTDLLAKAETADQENVRDGMWIAEELERRKVRAGEACNRPRNDEGTGEGTVGPGAGRASGEDRGAGSEDGSRRRTAERQAAPTAGGGSAADRPGGSDRRRIPHDACGGWRVRAVLQRQAVVAEGSLLVVATDVVQAANDKQQLQPMLNQVIALRDTLGKAETLLADNRCFSAANVAACEAAAVQR